MSICEMRRSVKDSSVIMNREHMGHSDCFSLTEEMWKNKENLVLIQWSMRHCSPSCVSFMCCTVQHPLMFLPPAQGVNMCCQWNDFFLFPSSSPCSYRIAMRRFVFSPSKQLLLWNRRGVIMTSLTVSVLILTSALSINNLKACWIPPLSLDVLLNR